MINIVSKLNTPFVFLAFGPYLTRKSQTKGHVELSTFCPQFPQACAGQWFLIDINLIYS